MVTTSTRIRTPVQRDGAEKYLLITLLSFAASVALTRLFLEVTGYPQIGNSTLHIAHVLWGGLFLYIAALLPLLFANRRVLLFSSIMSGIGIGLFIDEVGKFITQTNDYFYPPAAPIIYAFFLLTVLLYRQIRQTRRRDVRSELYSVLDGLEEVLDHDLSDRERADLIRRLDEISDDTDHPDFLRLIQGIRQFVAHESIHFSPHVPGYLERIKQLLKTWEVRLISPRSFRAILAGGMIAMGLWVLYYPILILIQSSDPEQIQLVLQELVEAELVTNQTGLNWFAARLALQSAVGVIQLLSALFIVSGRVRLGLGFSYTGLLLSLTTVNLLMFYFDQFSTIISASIQFLILMAVLYYRKNYLSKT